MLRGPTQSGLANWAFIGLLVAMGVALVGNLLITGLETYMASGNDWADLQPVPIATEVAACFPDRLVGDKLLLPDGVNPIIVREAIHAAFDVSQGDKATSIEGRTGSYPMDTPVAPCVLAATTRIYHQALASVPPPDQRCRGLLWRHVGHWLLVGWTPLLVFVGLVLLARRRARRTTRAE